MEGIDRQVIFLILFVIIGAIKWFIEKIQEKNNPPQDPNETLEDMYEDFREEIRRRQTEVQQPEAPAPPPLPRQPVAQEPQPAPVYTPGTAPANARIESFQVKKPKLSSEEAAALERLNRQSTSKRRNKGPNKSIRKLLATPNAAQQAIILKEVLGEPRSLQRI